MTSTKQLPDIDALFDNGRLKEREELSLKGKILQCLFVGCWINDAEKAVTATNVLMQHVDQETAALRARVARLEAILNGLYYYLGGDDAARYGHEAQANKICEALEDRGSFTP